MGIISLQPGKRSNDVSPLIWLGHLSRRLQVDTRIARPWHLENVVAASDARLSEVPFAYHEKIAKTGALRVG